MIVERSMHAAWLSNAFLLADEPGGTAVFVDSGAPLEPLIAARRARGRLTPTHLLVTHGHADHVAGNDELVERYGLEVTSGRSRRAGCGSSRSRRPATRTTASRSSSATSASRATRSSATPSAAGPADEMRRSVMDVLMTLPHGHACPSRAHGRDDHRARVGAEPVRPLLARCSTARTGARAP